MRSDRCYRFWLRPAAWVVMCHLLVPAGLAHDVYSSWTEAVVRETRLELTLTLARGSALRLIDQSKVSPPITPENFPEYAGRLKSVTPALFAITASGRSLKLSQSKVKISGDADITFRLEYPSPPKGSLKFTASYLFQLVDGHVGTLVVTDDGGHDLGWSPVTVDQPNFEIEMRPRDNTGKL